MRNERRTTAPPRPATEQAGRWIVYILRCRDGSLYTGITVDLEARIAKHNAGRGSRYTRARLPVEVAWSLDALDPTRARRLEYAIKQLPRQQKLRLIRGALPLPEVPP